jgi:hypothetical protein
LDPDPKQEMHFIKNHQKISNLIIMTLKNVNLTFSFQKSICFKMPFLLLSLSKRAYLGSDPKLDTVSRRESNLRTSRPWFSKHICKICKRASALSLKSYVNSLSSKTSNFLLFVHNILNTYRNSGTRLWLRWGLGTELEPESQQNPPDLKYQFLHRWICCFMGNF